MTTPDLRTTCSTSAATEDQVGSQLSKRKASAEPAVDPNFHEVVSCLLAGEVTAAEAAGLLGAPVLMEVFPGKRPPVPTTNLFADALAQGAVLSPSIACSVVDALRALEVDLRQTVRIVANGATGNLTLLQLATREGSSDLVAHLLGAGAALAPDAQPRNLDVLSELVDFARARAVDADAELRARIDGVIDVIVTFRARVHAHSLLEDIDAADHDGGVRPFPRALST